MRMYEDGYTAVEVCLITYTFQPVLHPNVCQRPLCQLYNPQPFDSFLSKKCNVESCIFYSLLAPPLEKKKFKNCCICQIYNLNFFCYFSLKNN